jgi:hypothetical protein
MPVPKLVDGVTIYVMTEEEKKQDIIRKMKKEEYTELPPESKPLTISPDSTEIKEQLNRIEGKLDLILAKGDN